MASPEVDDPESLKALAVFLLRHHSSDLRSIILARDSLLHYPLHIQFAELMNDDPPRAHLLFSQPLQYLRLFDSAAFLAQRAILEEFDWVNASVKESVHVRINISGSPLEFPETFPSIGRVRVKHRGILLTLKGTVIRSGGIKMIEGERKYECRKCKHMRTNELRSDMDIPDEVIMKFKQFWSDFKDTPLKGRNAILRGICPQVFGLFTVKLAVALTLIGGVQHVDASGTKVRGESHLLLVGDPGTGKSQFLKFAAKLSNRSVITTGLGSTSAGLTVTAVKDGGEWMLEAGALVLADGGLCCIDEFDSTRTIVFGATNPKGHYDPGQSLSVNTTLSGPLLSRFDIVLVLLDTKNPEWDAVVSSHILAEPEEPEKGKHDENLANIWPLPLLRRYINFVKGYFKPVLTKEAEKVISSYYQLQRRSATHNAARTTVRMLESLIRLAQAHARLMFRNEVTRLDAITAILCIESSMTTSAIVDSVGNALHSNFTENPDQEYAKQERLILEKLSSIDEFPDIISIHGSITG
ncbi:hypothetical protein PVL29_002468 [Vitis rotundifolia]|uniref:DNA helicase n=1 Tax=Vitis rotundifolia TaxID=103349 RepID=A0AA39AGY5_VITRO|nr:hypothetical protein PVL29_002468 [Vitis rotundifolia]